MYAGTASILCELNLHQQHDTTPQGVLMLERTLIKRCSMLCKQSCWASHMLPCCVHDMGNSPAPTSVAHGRKPVTNQANDPQGHTSTCSTRWLFSTFKQRVSHGCSRPLGESRWYLCPSPVMSVACESESRPENQEGGAKFHAHLCSPGNSQAQPPSCPPWFVRHRWHNAHLGLNPDAGWKVGEDPVALLVEQAPCCWEHCIRLHHTQGWSIWHAWLEAGTMFTNPFGRVPKLLTQHQTEFDPRISWCSCTIWLVHRGLAWPALHAIAVPCLHYGMLNFAPCRFNRSVKCTSMSTRKACSYTAWLQGMS